MSHLRLNFPLRLAACAALALACSSLFASLANAQGIGVYKDLHDFGGTVTNANGTAGPDGTTPFAGPTLDPRGDLFGTTIEGGPNTLTLVGAGEASIAETGMVWELTSAGVYKDLHDFGGTITNADGTTGPDGYAASGCVTIDHAGNLYGTTRAGGGIHLDYLGAPTNGMVWEVTASGAYKDLHDFGGTVSNASGTSVPDGSVPLGGVAFDSAGNMYGTASQGGANGGGMVWEITAAGLYKDLHDFGGTITTSTGAQGLDGAAPSTAVTVDASGDICGTAYIGGANATESNPGGMVWEITTAGDYKDLHDFGGTITNANGDSGPDGVQVVAAVSFGNAGNMYGTTVNGGANGHGLIWELTSALAYKDLHDFGGTVVDADGNSGPDGSESDASPVFDALGDMYGTTIGGGAQGGGIVWEITPNGEYKDLYDFGGTITTSTGASGPDGSTLYAGVSLDASGNIYGTNVDGGAYSTKGAGGGTVWEIAAIAPVAAFQPGLQMFSLPFSYAGVDLDALFGYSGVTLAVWSPANDSYALTPTAPADQIQVGQGYWARFPQAVTITAAGSPADSTQNFDIPLAAGWNMIGDPFTATVPVANLLFDNGTDTFDQATSGTNPLVGATLYTFPAGATQYSTATTIAPEQGYWIYAMKNTDVQVPHP